MGQEANNGGRSANLDEKKERAAGRAQNDPVREAILDANDPQPAKGQTGGAFGKDDVAERHGGGGAASQGAGGGGGGPAPAKDKHTTTGTKGG